MPTQEEVLKIIFEIQNQNRIAEARKEIENERKAIADLDDQMKRGVISQTQYQASIQAVGRRAAEAAADIARAQAAIGKSTTAATADSTRGFGRATQGATQFAYAIDDLGAGMRGVGNNIVYAAAQIGGPWGAAVAVAAAAGIGLYENWDKVAGTLGLAAAKTETMASAADHLTERLKELNDKPIKLAIEYREIDILEGRAKQAKEGAAAFEGLKGLRSEGEQAIGKDIQEVLREAPGGAKQVAEDAGRARLNALSAVDPAILDAQREQAADTVTLHEAQKKLQDKSLNAVEAGLAQLDKDAAEARIAKSQETARLRRRDLEAEANEYAGNVAKGAMGGDPEKQRELVELLRSAGRDALADQVKRASSERDFVEQHKRDQEFDAGAQRHVMEERERAEKAFAEQHRREQAFDAGAQKHVLEEQEKAEKATHRAAGIYGGALSGRVEEIMLTGRDRGASDKAVDEALRAQVMRSLINVPAKQQGAVADEILKSAREKADAETALERNDPWRKAMMQRQRGIVAEQREQMGGGAFGLGEAGGTQYITQQEFKARRQANAHSSKADKQMSARQRRIAGQFAAQRRRMMKGMVPLGPDGRVSQLSAMPPKGAKKTATDKVPDKLDRQTTLLESIDRKIGDVGGYV